MPDIIFPEWRDENSNTNYPFSDIATLTNGSQTLPQGLFADAAIYPIGGSASMYLSSVIVTYATITLTIGSAENKSLASGSFSTVSPPATVALVDAYDRPAGLLLSSGTRLAIFSMWGTGTFVFTKAQTELIATVCMPQPAVGVRGVQLPDGTLLTGDVWLVGDNGVVLRSEQVDVPRTACQAAETYNVIRFDVVGDPLFRRRLCEPVSLFHTPKFLEKLVFKDSKQRVEIRPDESGDVKITVNNAMAADTVLRIHPTSDGNVFDVVGSLQTGGA